MTDCVEIDYTNHEGERAWRKLAPMTPADLWYGTSPHHEGAQWFLAARALDRGGFARDFAVSGIHGIRQGHLPLVHVVAAIITRKIDGRTEVLLSRRGPSEVPAFDRRWTFAGGKVDPGETTDVALVREVREELGVLVRPGATVVTSVQTVDGFPRPYLMQYIEAERVLSSVGRPGEPRIRAGEPAMGHCWFGLDEVESLATTPGTLFALRTWREGRDG